MFCLDATKVGAGLFYFHSGENEMKSDIVWQGQEYVALPIEASGFSYDSGAFPRPKIKLANIQGIFSVLVRSYNDLIGMKITRKRTSVRFLDAVNFEGGNPDANPGEYLEDEIYFITQKTSENKLYIEFELGGALDLSGVYLPRRMVVANHCQFRYRGEECAYTGNSYFNVYGIAVGDSTKDVCGKRLSDCKLRFGTNGELSFGGFPGSAVVSVS